MFFRKSLNDDVIDRHDDVISQYIPKVVFAIFGIRIEVVGKL